MAARLRGARRSVSSLALATWEIAEQTPAVLNLAIGQPALSLLPMEAVQDGAARLSTYDARHILQYGAPAGSGHYLSALAGFLTAQLQCAHDPSTLFATTGNSGGLALVIRTLTTPGDAVLMEEPSYFLAHKLFRDYGCTLQPVRQRMDGGGTIDVEALGRSLETLSKATKATAGTGTPASMPRLLYCIPTGNNPTGSTMPDGDRAQLVALCTQYGVTIVADDVYEMLQWRMDGAPKPLRWHAQQQGAAATVVSLGSWSKILGPGLRLGWIEAEGEMLQRLAADGEVDSGSFSSPLVESLVAKMIEQGAVRVHLEALRTALSRRAVLLAGAINGELPEGIPPVVASAPAGYFLWVDLRGADANALRERCTASHGVSFLPGTRCALEADVAPSYARVCFAFLEEVDLAEAGRRLGRAIAAGHTGSSSGD